MFSQLFGNYLMEKGVIDKAGLKKMLQEQSEARVKMGTIAVAEKILTEQQAEEINHLQTQMDKRFGDIAVEKGYLTEQQVLGLLQKQGNSYMKLMQILTDSLNISVSVIDEHLLAFQKERGFTDAEMCALKQDDIDSVVPVFAYASKPYVTDMVGLVLRNITRFITTDYYIDRIKHVNNFSYSFISGQKVTGDHTIYLAFASEKDDDGILKLASAFSKEELTAVDSETADAISEFANINNGLFASELSEKGVDIDMEPPFTYMNQTAEGSAYVLPVHFFDSVVNIYISVDSPMSIGKIPYVYSLDKTEGSEVTADSKGTVVIVDDSKMIRKMLRAILEEAGYTVVAEAANGLEAVVVYKQFNPDTITLDITMPQMDGVEALKEIKKYDPDANVIMITAAGQQQKVIQALKLGASKFIMKPFMKDEVLNGFERK
ncbi:MAG: response regulator [Butyrivibrio sp.]